MAPEEIGFELRLATDLDRPFLYQLKCLKMCSFIEALWGWDETFQCQDFEQRRAAYEVWVIIVEGRSDGTLWLEWKTTSLYIHDIQIFPHRQSHGLGSAVLRGVLRQAAEHSLPVQLSVFDINARAKALYERLGFKTTATDGRFVRMQYGPTA